MDHKQSAAISWDKRTKGGQVGPQTWKEITKVSDEKTHEKLYRNEQDAKWIPNKETPI